MKQTQILILDSNENFTKELEEVISKREGMHVCGKTDDGAEGLELIKSENPTVVIMSLFLRNIDGISVMDEVRKLQKKPEIIVMGNFSDDKSINRAISLGARYYLMKPVDPEVVADRAAEIASDEEAFPHESVERKRASSLDERITNIFISIGIPPHIKGYKYLREGIKLAVEDPQIINNVTKKLYPIIGDTFGTTASKVERAIRHAIEVAWNRGRIEAVNAIFGARVYIGTEKPTNSEFIALVADKLILENMV